MSAGHCPRTIHHPLVKETTKWVEVMIVAIAVTPRLEGVGNEGEYCNCEGLPRAQIHVSPLPNSSAKEAWSWKRL